MEATAIVAIVQLLLGAAFRLWDSADKIKGNTPIPSWDDLTNSNRLLQEKIDAEKGA